MEIILASNNKGKIKELTELFSDKGFTIRSMQEVGYKEDIEETGISLFENAYLKANAIYDRYKIPALADDSGLFIDALNGEPGVYSARYAGAQKNDEDNIQKVLTKLADTSNRRAHFSCVLCLAIYDTYICFEGKVQGNITLEKAGEGGFGYDPIFIPDGFDETFATLSSNVKNTISHRANALKELLKHFESENYSKP